MTHIRTCSISSPGTRYPAEKVLFSRFSACPVAHVSRSTSASCPRSGSCDQGWKLNLKRTTGQRTNRWRMCGVKRTNDIGETFEVMSSFHRKVLIPLRLSEPKTCHFKVSVVKGVDRLGFMTLIVYIEKQCPIQLSVMVDYYLSVAFNRTVNNNKL